MPIKSATLCIWEYVCETGKEESGGEYNFRKLGNSRGGATWQCTDQQSKSWSKPMNDQRG